MPGKVQFGVFEFDPNAMELRKDGVRIRLQEQPFRVLASLIERPGEIITREQLKERIWDQDTFVDFDQSLNKAVNRLREALNDDAGKPRYIETIPRRGYRFVAHVTGTGPLAVPPKIPDRAASWARSRAIAIIAAAGLVLVAVVTALALLRNPNEPPRRAPIRITTNGNSMQPTLSRDGKLLAYTSLGEGGVGHIWVRQTAGGEALQVTRGSGGESEPSFSPDGTSIAFRSETDDGGAYIVPTFRGEPMLAAKGGLWPRWSPAGEQLWCMDSHFRGMLVPARGGVPKLLTQSLNWIGPFLGYQSVPVWAPDGKQILYLGRDNGSKEILWRIAAPAGGASKAVSLHEFRGGGEPFPLAHAWIRMNNGRQWIVYSAATGDSHNLFRVEISSNGDILGRPEQLTSGAGLIPDATISPDGKLAFASSSLNERIYLIPIKSKSGESPQDSPLTRSEALRNRSPSISRDGRWLAYAATNLLADQTAIRLRDLVTGNDRLLVDGVSPSENDFLSISPDGSKVLFSHLSVGNNQTRVPSCSMVAAAGGFLQKVSENCTSPRGFSSDGSIVLVHKPNEAGPNRIAAIDLISEKETEFLSPAHKAFGHPFFSWDDRWVVFTMRMDWNHVKLLVAPVRSGMPAGETKWITITDGHYADDKPQFSPDGNQIYFTSDRDGYLCIWAQPLNPATKHPEGKPYVVHHFHSAVGWYAKNYYPFRTVITVARDKILTCLHETHSDIWMLRVD